MKPKQDASRRQRAWRFVSRDIWDIEMASLSAVRRCGVQVLRVLHLVFNGFQKDECLLHASALTFSSLMALVPMLALSLALARGLGGGEAAKQWLREGVAEWTNGFRTAQLQSPGVPAYGGDDLSPEDFAHAVRKLLDRAFEKVENVSFAALGGVGLLVLVWMVIDVLARVEYAFNRVWGITSGRTLWRKTTDYLAVVIIVPFLVLAASSMPVADLLTRNLGDSSAQAVRAFLGSGLLNALTVGVMTSLCMTFLLVFMPNTRVRLSPGLWGGITAGLLFLGWLWLCAIIQGGVARFGRIYGSFAVFPIILAWVHVSWQIILFGAEVAFALQNSATYVMEQGSNRPNARARILLALSIAAECGRAMLAEGPGFHVASFARARRVPVRFINDVVGDLVAAGLLAPVSEESGRYVLLRAPGRLLVSEVVGVVLQSGAKPENLGLNRVDAAVAEAVETALGGVDRALKQVTVQDILRVVR
jgi:membrane protein